MKNPNKETYDKIAEIYSKEMTQRMTWQKSLEEFATFMPQSAEIVELGCGAGNETSWLAEHIERANVTGIDFSSEMIRLANEKATPNTTFIQTEIPTYIHQKSADGIWARGTLHHLTPDELVATFCNASKYLSPSGTFCCINKYGQGEVIKETSRYGDPVENYFNYFNEVSVPQYIIGTNLEIVQQYQMANDEKTPYIVTYLKLKS